MRSFIFFVSLLVMSFFVVPEVAYSQDTGTGSAMPDLDTPIPVPDPAAESSVNDYDPYDLATDEQIKEAQRFYESCKSNETLNKQKDCKCAAAAFLETRVKLGSAASIDEIMKANINTCLLDESKSKISDVDDLELEEITEQQREEAERVYIQCTNNKDFRNAVDCECLAARFLDLRIKRGSVESSSVMIAEITQKYCRNIVETTGIEYTRCMTGTSFDYRNIRPKDYCECYARMWGKLFENYKGRMDEYKKSNIRLQARARCYKPSSYDK